MYVEPLNVKVIRVEGQDYLCTVYPMVEPRDIDRTWQPNPSRHTPHRYVGDDENLNSLQTYAATKLDQEF